MADKALFPAKVAYAVADKLAAELASTAARIEIAGSLRRKKPFDAMSRSIFRGLIVLPMPLACAILRSYSF
jgi:hypothetical protein